MINTKKTTAMSFHTWQNKGALKPQIILQGMDIDKYETKFFGVHMTEDIKWDGWSYETFRLKIEY